ncbi:MAG: hypothetical protein ABTQ32_33105 [Myxococcaceae bacterium]
MTTKDSLEGTRHEEQGAGSEQPDDDETVQEILTALKEADEGGEFVTSEELWASIRARPRH